MTIEKTDSVLRWQGMNLLIKYLGEVDAERFISLMIRELFDYTKWREENLPDEDVLTLSQKAMNLVSGS